MKLTITGSIPVPRDDGGYGFVSAPIEVIIELEDESVVQLIEKVETWSKQKDKGA